MDSREVALSLAADTVRVRRKPVAALGGLSRGGRSASAVTVVARLCASTNLASGRTGDALLAVEAEAIVAGWR